MVTERDDWRTADHSLDGALGARDDAVFLEKLPAGDVINAAKAAEIDEHFFDNYAASYDRDNMCFVWKYVFYQSYK